MKKLLAEVARCQENLHEARNALFPELARGRSLEPLFIAGASSRFAPDYAGELPARDATRAALKPITERYTTTIAAA